MNFFNKFKQTLGSKLSSTKETLEKTLDTMILQT